jgi:ribonuclease P protein component
LGDAARKAAGSRGLGSADFAALFKSPKRARSRHFSLFWRSAESAALGMVVSKKLAGNAIRRNLVKRHAREAFRACVSAQAQAADGFGEGGLEVVIRVSANIRALPRAEQFAEITALFAKCGRRDQERASQ